MGVCWDYFWCVFWVQVCVYVYGWCVLTGVHVCTEYRGQKCQVSSLVFLTLFFEERFWAEPEVRQFG